MPTAPEVSAVVPTRDRWPLLTRALGCVLAQTGVEVEAVVVDDGSAEAAPAGHEALADPRVRVIRHETSQGVARARNRAVQEARGRWVAFLDDDDLWAPGKLAAQVAAADTAGAGFVYTGTVWLDPAGQATQVYEASPPGTVAEDLHSTNVIGTPSCLMASREAVQAAGGFDPAFSVLADWDLWLRLAERERAASCPEPLTGYVVHEASMHQTDMDRVWREFSALKRKHARPGRAFGGHDYRMWMASVYRGQGRRLQAARAHAAIARHDRRPKELVRAAGLLLGERAMRAVAGPLPPPAPRPPTPGWVAPLIAGAAVPAG